MSRIVKIPLTIERHTGGERDANNKFYDFPPELIPATFSIQPFQGDQAIDLVEGLQDDFGLAAEDFALDQVEGQAIEGGKRVRGDPGLPPLDHVTIVVVVRWLDDNQVKFSWR